MLSRDHNILWLPESNGYPTRTILGATLHSLACREPTFPGQTECERPPKQAVGQRFDGTLATLNAGFCSNSSSFCIASPTSFISLAPSSRRP